MSPRFAIVLVTLLGAGSPLPAQTKAARPAAAAAPARVELEDLRTALETAIGRPGRIRLAAGARTAGRVYRLKGYGAVIVLAPRALPARPFVGHRRGLEGPGGFAPAGAGPRVVITVPEGTFELGPIDLGDLEREMEVQMAAQAAAMREWETGQHEWTRASEEEIREHLRLVEQQAEAFRLEAERARRKAEREVRTRLAPPAPVPPVPPIPPAAPSAPAPLVPPPAPVAPVSAEPFFTAELPFPPEPPDAPPPWRFWFDVTDASGLPEETDTTDADAVVTSVREGVVAGLETYRRPLASLRPEDFVTVAVDLVPDVILHARPVRTLLVRVRAGDLQDRGAGRLSAAELRKRVEFEEN